MALTLCEELIADNITKDCTNPIFEGLESIGYIMNKKDLDSGSVTLDASNSHIVKAMTLLSPAKAFKIYNPTKNPFDGTASNMAEGDLSNKNDNVLQFLVLDDGPKVAKDVIDPLTNGEFVAVVANKHQNATGDNKFQIFGLDKGLRMTARTRNLTTGEQDGGHLVTMTEAGAPRYGVYFFDTDVATSRAALEALC